MSRPPAASLADAIIDLGRPGGPLDGRDDLGAGSRDHPTSPAGAAFLVQFLAHDLTSRAPALDLDAVYRGGPLQARPRYAADPRSARLFRREHDPGWIARGPSAGAQPHAGPHACAAWPQPRRRGRVLAGAADPALALPVADRARAVADA